MSNLTAAASSVGLRQPLPPPLRYMIARGPQRGAVVTGVDGAGGGCMHAERVIWVIFITSY